MYDVRTCLETPPSNEAIGGGKRRPQVITHSPMVPYTFCVQNSFKTTGHNFIALFIAKFCANRRLVDKSFIVPRSEIVELQRVLSAGCATTARCPTLLPIKCRVEVGCRGHVSSVSCGICVFCLLVTMW